MTKLKKILGSLVLGVVLSLNIGLVAFADGELMSEPFGDCGAKPTLAEPAKYYDFLVPFTITRDQIGGWAITATSTGGNPVYVNRFNLENNTKRAQCKLGCEHSFNLQGHKGSSWLGHAVLVDSNTGAQYIEMNGLKMYIASLPSGLFNYSGRDKLGIHAWSMLSATGVLYDVVLKDGTVIHFATGDGAGNGHTNGGPPSQQDGVQYGFNELKQGQYKNIFHACDPMHTFEMFMAEGSNLSDFTNYYNIGDSNPVVAVRLWSATVKDGNFTVNEGCGELSFGGSSLNLQSGSGENSTNPQFLKGYYDEMDLAAWSYLSGESVIEFKDRSDLDQSDLTGLYNWENNIESNKFSLIRLIRYIISFMGIMFITWGSFFYLGYWFDRINPIIPVRMVNLLSFGKLEVAPDERECNFRMSDIGKGKLKTINHWIAVEIALMAIGFGTLLVSGWAYKLIAWLIRFVTSRIGR